MRKITSFALSRCKGVLVLLSLLFSFSGQAQQDYTLQFENQNVTIPENIDSFQWQSMPESSQLGGGYFGWVQFYETPSQPVQDRFKQNNLQLLEYIPNKAYLFYFPENTSVTFLKDNGVRSIIPIPGEYKLSWGLKNAPYPDYATQGDNLLVTLQHHKNVNTDFVIQDLATKQISVAQRYKGSNNIDLLIPNNCLETLADLPYVKWVELIVAPSTPDDTRGRSLHRANGLDTQTGAGRNYTGAGIGVMVRDDGIVGPHIDFQGRIDNSFATGSGPDHGDGVGGIMAGAGNLDPTMRGMAAGSNVWVSNYQANFLDTATQTLINNGSVQITNSSYSNGCNAGYTTITETVDEQTINIPSLLHVFSAGNSNNNNCGYGAGSQWGNITGGHKQGKNVIATANVFFDGSLVNSSSRGPAHDGRIKPDITANGQNQMSTDENNTYMSFGGTSGAAPGIAGISAQLYEAYALANGGTLPPSALIKATLLNTANEAGNIGPDFKFGWGIVNGLRAGKLIEDGRYLSDNVSQGNSNTHTISVPSGTTQVRFMVYWSDPAASPGTNLALVNDLDMVVTTPSNTDLLPWILDSTPNATALDTPATNGPDHLNNVEQVLVNNPAAGTYDIEISGFNVPMGPQEYFVVYEIISENLTVTYPNAGESFVPGETEAIHWDAINTTEDFLLEYSVDNGSTWSTITTVPNDETLYSWNVPNNVTGNAQIRVTSGSFSDASDETFSIAAQPTGVELAQLCPDSATFAWNAVAGAESYDLYLLGSEFMEVVGTTTTNSINIPITDPNAEIWAAVVAKNATQGWESRRTIAINHAGGLVNCSLANDLGVIQIDNELGDFSICNPNTEVIVSATIRNTGIDAQSNFNISYQFDSDPIVTETFTGTLSSGQQESYEFSTPLPMPDSGNHTLVVTLNLSGDQNPANDQAEFTFFADTQGAPLDFAETFDTNGFPPPAWTMLNPDGLITWVERTNITGSDGNSTTTSFIDNYTYNAAGQEDIFQTQIIDLTGVASATLTFDLAKAQYSSSFSDGLSVAVSTDCGTTFTSVYDKEGLDLSTMPGYVTTAGWTPSSANNWRTEAIDLTPYAGEYLVVRFVNINGYGNSTLIDNVNVTEEVLATNAASASAIALYPNPASNQVFVDFGSTVIQENVKVTLSNSLGQRLQVLRASNFNGAKGTLDISQYASGLYFISIENGDVSVTKKLLVK